MSDDADREVRPAVGQDLYLPNDGNDNDLLPVIDHDDERESDDESSDFSDMPDGTSLGTGTKLAHISHIYCAAKTVDLSPQLMADILDSHQLLRALAIKECSIDNVKSLCNQDQLFAAGVHDDIGVLRQIVVDIKEEDADSKFVDHTPVVTLRKKPEIAKIDFVKVTASRYDSSMLDVISVAYENRINLIQRWMWFLQEVLETLKENEQLLGRHLVEISRLFCFWQADATKFMGQLPKKFPPRVGDFSSQRSQLLAFMQHMKEYMHDELGSTLVESQEDRKQPAVVSSSIRESVQHDAAVAAPGSPIVQSLPHEAAEPAPDSPPATQDGLTGDLLALSAIGDETFHRVTASPGRARSVLQEVLESEAHAFAAEVTSTVAVGDSALPVDEDADDDGTRKVAHGKRDHG
jgi:hypothetical protein